MTKQYAAAYDIYLRYTAIITLFKSKAYSTQEIKEVTGYPQTSTYRMVKDLLDRGVIVCTGRKFDEGGKSVKVYKYLISPIIGRVAEVDKDGNAIIELGDFTKL